MYVDMPKYTFANAYQDALHGVFTCPDYETAPRGMKIKERMNYIFTVMYPEYNLYENVVRSSPLKYICQELIWYLSRDRKVTYIGKHADLWNRIAEDGKVNSNYGYLAFSTDQYAWAFNILREDKESRQAVMHFNGCIDPRENPKDFICTLTVTFHIRNNALNMTVVMRSQDIIYGLPADFVWFSVLQQQMRNALAEHRTDSIKHYPDLELGTYTHIVHSLHLYEKHFDLAERMLKEEFKPAALPHVKADLLYSYDMLMSVSNVMYNTAYEIEDEFLRFICENAK